MVAAVVGTVAVKLVVDWVLGLIVAAPRTVGRVVEAAMDAQVNRSVVVEAVAAVEDSSEDRSCQESSEAVEIEVVAEMFRVVVDVQAAVDRNSFEEDVDVVEQVAGDPASDNGTSVAEVVEARRTASSVSVATLVRKMFLGAKAKKILRSLVHGLNIAKISILTIGLGGALGCIWNCCTVGLIVAG